MKSSELDVFVSYKSEDRPRLKPLVSALEAEGFTVWWDAHIDGGTNWHEVIETHLEAAKCVIVAWTKLSVGHDGHFVRDEARRAQRRDAYATAPVHAGHVPDIERTCPIWQMQGTPDGQGQGHKTLSHCPACMSDVQSRRKDTIVYWVSNTAKHHPQIGWRERAP